MAAVGRTGRISPSSPAVAVSLRDPGFAADPCRDRRFAAGHDPAGKAVRTAAAALGGYDVVRKRPANRSDAAGARSSGDTAARTASVARTATGGAGFAAPAPGGSATRNGGAAAIRSAPGQPAPRQPARFQPA